MKTPAKSKPPIPRKISKKKRLNEKEVKIVGNEQFSATVSKQTSVFGNLF